MNESLPVLVDSENGPVRECLSSILIVTVNHPIGDEHRPSTLGRGHFCLGDESGVLSRLGRLEVTSAGSDFQRGEVGAEIEASCHNYCAPVNRGMERIAVVSSHPWWGYRGVLP